MELREMRQDEDFSDFYANYSLNEIVEDRPINSIGNDTEFALRNNPEVLIERELYFSQVGDRDSSGEYYSSSTGKTSGLNDTHNNDDIYSIPYGEA